LIENPLSGFESHNAAASSSKTEAHTVNSSKTDTHIENNILKNTIPVVREVLQGAAKGLDAYLPRDNIVNSAPQLDARGSNFTDVGRDQHQHYHVHLTV